MRRLQRTYPSGAMPKAKGKPKTQSKAMNAINDNCAKPTKPRRSPPGRSRQQISQKDKPVSKISQINAKPKTLGTGP